MRTLPLLIAVVFLTLPVAQAAKGKARAAHKQKKHALEVYSAVEDEMTGAPVAVAPATADVRPTAPYDPVPSDQADALAKRLKLVDELIRRHARAYDYRTLTVRELEGILQNLEAAQPASNES